MGIVVQEKCPKCKQGVFLAIDCPQMRCPHCNNADIINRRKKNRKKISPHKKEKKRYVLGTLDVKINTCPKCGTKFSSSPVLTKGKLFCPQCSNPLSPSSK